jgi:hypothetical protein
MKARGDSGAGRGVNPGLTRTGSGSGASVWSADMNKPLDARTLQSLLGPPRAASTGSRADQHEVQKQRRGPKKGWANRLREQAMGGPAAPSPSKRQRLATGHLGLAPNLSQVPVPATMQLMQEHNRQKQLKLEPDLMRQTLPAPSEFQVGGRLLHGGALATACRGRHPEGRLTLALPVVLL